jgi:hypothetical protein
MQGHVVFWHARGSTRLASLLVNFLRHTSFVALIYLPTFSNMSLVPRDKIQEKIKYHYNEIVSLRRMHNSYAAIAKLPPEMLAYILWFCLPVLWPHTSYYGDPFKKFIALTQVCSQWRTAALNTPSLWSIVPCGSLVRTTKVLERARGVPLSATIDLHALRTQRSMVQEILGNLSRIRSLDIDHTLADRSFLEPILSNPAPYLETLVLKTSDNYGERDNWQFPLFGGDAPRLTTLVSVSSRLFHALQAPSLRRLTLFGHSSSFISVSELVDTLQNTPSLESINLNQTGLVESSSREAKAMIPVVRLPFLRYLSVAGNGQYVHTLVLSMDMPALISLNLTASALDSASYEEILKSQAVITVLSSYNGDIMSVKASSSQAVGGVVAKQILAVLPISTARREAASFNIYVLGSPHQTEIIRLLVDMVAKIRGPDLTMSIDDSDTKLDKDAWLKLFGQHHLKTLRVSGTGIAAGLIDALASRVKIKVKSLRSDIILKKEAFFLARLEDLWLTDVELTTLYGKPKKTLLRLLKARLRTRCDTLRKRDEPFAKLNLHIHGCTGFDEEAQEDFEDKLGIRIDWDCSTGSTEDEEEEDDYDGHDPYDCGRSFCELCELEGRGVTMSDLEYL